MVFYIFFKFQYNILYNGIPDQMLHDAVSDPGLRCLPMSHKKDARLIWVKR